jgi:hypothetical protein
MEDLEALLSFMGPYFPAEASSSKNMKVWLPTLRSQQLLTMSPSLSNLWTPTTCYTVNWSRSCSLRKPPSYPMRRGNQKLLPARWLGDTFANSGTQVALENSFNGSSKASWDRQGSRHQLAQPHTSTSCQQYGHLLSSRRQAIVDPIQFSWPR